MDSNEAEIREAVSDVPDLIDVRRQLQRMGDLSCTSGVTAGIDEVVRVEAAGLRPGDLHHDHHVGIVERVERLCRLAADGEVGVPEDRDVGEVVVVEAGAGNAAAAVNALRAIEHYKPSVALFVGVAGGVKDVAIGDVVVGTTVYGYESGKDEAGGFKPRPDLLSTAYALQQRARVLRQSDSWKNRLDPALGHRNPQVFVAPIAAGEKVRAARRPPWSCSDGASDGP